MFGPRPLPSIVSALLVVTSAAPASAQSVPEVVARALSGGEQTSSPYSAADAASGPLTPVEEAEAPRPPRICAGASCLSETRPSSAATTVGVRLSWQAMGAATTGEVRRASRWYLRRVRRCAEDAYRDEGFAGRVDIGFRLRPDGERVGLLPRGGTARLRECLSSAVSRNLRLRRGGDTLVVLTIDVLPPPGSEPPAPRVERPVLALALDRSWTSRLACQLAPSAP